MSAGLTICLTSIYFFLLEESDPHSETMAVAVGITLNLNIYIKVCTL